MTFVPRCVLVTGGAGFVGACFVQTALERNPALCVLNLDCLTYAGDQRRLAGLEQAGRAVDGRYAFIHANINDRPMLAALLAGERPPSVQRRWAGGPPDAVVHLAAESHVDRSILEPDPFIETNVLGTQALLEACRSELQRRPRPFRFIHVSTDEVLGDLEAGADPWREDAPLCPTNPYAASKAAADLIVGAYVRSFGLPAIIARPTNVLGPWQFPEKLIPLMITRALAGRPLPIYGDGRQTREWLHVQDLVDALLTLLGEGAPGETYHIGSGDERSNIEVVRALLRLLGRPDTLIRHVRDRPGHDRRYALAADRIRTRTRWAPVHGFDEALVHTVDWYQANREWWSDRLAVAFDVADTVYLRDG